MDTPKIDIAALGRLARMEFPPAEGEKYASQLPKIVDYVGQLQKVETDIVAEEHAPEAMRVDEAETSPARDAILDAAPERDGDFWKVKAVL